jgi:hypothetical protein
MSQNITPGQVRYIQTMRRRLGLEEDDYRLMLWNVAGVKSCKLLRGGKVEAVIRHLERCLGKGPSEVSSQKAAVGEPGPAVLRATLRQIEEIRRRWGRVSHYPPGRVQDMALKNWLRRTVDVNHLNFLTREQASKCIEGLKQMERRSGMTRQGAK